MPKPKSLTDKEKDLKDFIQLTWEVVRLNQDYQADYEKYKKTNPIGMRKAAFDRNLKRYVWDDEEPPDP